MGYGPADHPKILVRREPNPPQLQHNFQPSPGKWDVGTAIRLHQLEQGKMCNCPKADAEKEVMCSHG